MLNKKLNFEMFYFDKSLKFKFAQGVISKFSLKKRDRKMINILW